MTTQTHRTLRLGMPLLLSVLVFGVVLTWKILLVSPDQRVTMHFDGPQYNSIEDLAAEAEVVVEVKIRDRVGSVIDYGGEEPVIIDPIDGEEVNQQGIPLAIYEAQVFQNHGRSRNHPTSSEFRNGDRILIAMLDEELVAGHSVVRLSQSERYLLFLSEVSDTSTLDVDLDGRPLYITLNDSNGVLEFNGREMQPNDFVLGVTRAEAQEELAERATAPESIENEVHEVQEVDAVLAAVDEVRD